jgi:hypothetical protein
MRAIHPPPALRAAASGMRHSPSNTSTLRLKPAAPETRTRPAPLHRFDPSKRQYLSSHVKQHKARPTPRVPGTSMPELVLSDPNRPSHPPAPSTHAPAHRALVEADGIEPTTPCLQSRCSPTELRPLALPAHLPCLGTRARSWWAREDLNFRPHAYQARALTN